MIVTMSAIPTDERRPRRPRPRVTVIGVIGELLITAGLLVLLFLGWQLWLNDIIVGNRLESESAELAEEWEAAPPAPLPEPSEPAEPGEPVTPPVRTAPAETERFALLVVPSFGDDYRRPIAEGVGTQNVLNQGELGHYPSTQMPGEVGNFAIASHRKAYGGNLEHIHELELGDPIVVETPDGWYTYRFRNLEYVQPTGVGVIDPVPQQTDFEPGDRLITLTSCNPFFSTAERIIAYGVFDAFTPRADGAPAEVADIVAEAR